MSFFLFSQLVLMLDTKIFTSFLLTNRNWKNSKEENQRIHDAKHWKVNCLDTFPLEAQQHQIKGESCELQVYRKYMAMKMCYTPAN